jgi:hypothetical protein
LPAANPLTARKLLVGRPELCPMACQGGRAQSPMRCVATTWSPWPGQELATTMGVRQVGAPAQAIAMAVGASEGAAAVGTSGRSGAAGADGEGGATSGGAAAASH